MSHVGFLYFDLGNVLLHFDHGIACRQMAEVSGLTPAAVRQTVFESGLELQYERGELTTVAFYEEFCRRTSTRPAMAPLLEAASRIFAANEPVFELVEQLRLRSPLPRGILSNTCEAHWTHVVAEYPLITRAFPLLTLSYLEVCVKPDAEIYTRAQQHTGLDAEQLFFVDDRAENVDAAREAGWDAVQYESAAQLRGELEARGVL